VKIKDFKNFNTAKVYCPELPKKNLKAERIKNRWLYDAGLMIISAAIIFLFIEYKGVWELQDYLIFFLLGGSGVFAGARAYYFDRFRRIIRKKPIIDFWLFLDNTKFEWLMFIYFFIRPVLGKREDLNLEKTRRIINFYAISAYVFIAGLIFILIYE
jgi:hypothetical protein